MMESQGQKVKIMQRYCTLHADKLAAWAEEMWEGKDIRAGPTHSMSSCVETDVFPLSMTAPCLSQFSSSLTHGQHSSHVDGNVVILFRWIVNYFI